MIQLSSYYHIFIVEAVCNEVDAADDGCFTPRHGIILGGGNDPFGASGSAAVLCSDSIAAAVFIRTSSAIQTICVLPHNCSLHVTNNTYAPEGHKSLRAS